MDSAVEFRPSQIVCLQHEGTCLYAEVIQIVESRQICWVRPLMLAVAPSSDRTQPDQTILYDLRQGVDLLWPAILFRPALDTEVLPLLTHLQISKIQSENTQVAHQQLRDFISQVWQAYQNKFRC